jgi:uncharacterized protein with FMN-binding domain
MGAIRRKLSVRFARYSEVAAFHLEFKGGRKMRSLTGSKLIGLCTVAISTIYAAGYLYTQPVADASAAGTPPGIARAGIHTQVSPGTSASSTPASAPAANHAKSTVYKDGVYSGAGSNPYGTLSVAVRILAGKISSVQVTSYAMHYPQSIIDPQLPAEAVSKQTWRINIISGATASTYNFAEAVYYALQKAKA